MTVSDNQMNSTILLLILILELKIPSDDPDQSKNVVKLR